VLSVYGRPDDEIGQEITKNVILTLEGRPETVRQGRDILAEAWRVEGVVSVRDRLTYPDGM
jgi:hypothetical protein